MQSSIKSADVVRQFFTAFGKGDMDGIVQTFHPEAAITAVRQGQRKEGQIHGSYIGRDGAKTFVKNLGATFDTRAFAVNHVVGDGDVAFANGSFTHQVRATGKLFTSDWALMCVVKDGMIAEYHFFEDSAAFVDASR